MRPPIAPLGGNGGTERQATRKKSGRSISLSSTAIPMRLPLSVLLLSCSLSLSATTYYVSANGNDLYTGTSATTPWKTVSRLRTASFTSGDQVLFRRGDTWREELDVPASSLTVGAYGTGARPILTGANLISSGWASAGTNVWSVSLSIAPSQVWFGGALGSKMTAVSALKGLNQWIYSGNKLYVYSATNPSSAQVEASQRDFALAMDYTSNVNVNSLHLSKGNSFTVFVGSNVGGTQTFQDVVWDGSPGEGLMVLGGFVRITGSIGHDNQYGLGVYGGGGLTLSNSILSGNTDTALWIAGTTGPSSIDSSTISGNSILNNLAPTIENDSQSLIASNSILLPNPYLASTSSFLGLTDNGTNVQKSPVFTARATPMIVVPYIDDYSNMAVAQAVAATAKSYGFHLTWALNTARINAQDWPTIAQFPAQGHELAAHTRTHSDLAYLKVFTISYTGTATSAKLTINIPSKKIQTFLNGSATPDINYTIPDYYPAAYLCNDISAIPGYSCSMTPVQSWWTAAFSSQTYFNPLNFADVSLVDIKTPYVVSADASRYYSYELQGAKTDIETNVPGYKVRTMATPYSSSSNQVENLIRDAGFEMNRNVMNDTPQEPSSYQLSHLDIFNVSSLLPSYVNLSNPKLSVDALVEAIGAGGGIYAFYSHGYDEFSLAQWDSFFAELKAIGATCMTASEATTYIKSHGTLVQDGTNRFWNSSIVPSPNYVPSATSPAQGAHILQ